MSPRAAVIPAVRRQGLPATELRGYRRKTRDRFLCVLEVAALKEGSIDHGKNGCHDRKSYYASHAAYLG